jgi:hypothetical protein
MQGQTSGPKLSDKGKYAALGGVIGVVATLFLGFGYPGDWVTGDTHQEAVAHEAAVGACVQAFLLQPDRQVIYTAVKEQTSRYRQRSVLDDHEIKTSTSAVGYACAERIAAFDASAITPPPADVVPAVEEAS